LRPIGFPPTHRGVGSPHRARPAKIAHGIGALCRTVQLSRTPPWDTRVCGADPLAGRLRLSADRGSVGGNQAFGKPSGGCGGVGAERGARGARGRGARGAARGARGARRAGRGARSAGPRGARSAARGAGARGTRPSAPRSRTLATESGITDSVAIVTCARNDNGLGTLDGSEPDDLAAPTRSAARGTAFSLLDAISARRWRRPPRALT
jgi:hypothetical protein